MSSPARTSTAPRRQAGRRTTRSLARSEDLLGRTLVTPTMLVILLVVIFPFLISFILAFQDIRLIDIGPLGDGLGEWTLDNFRRIFTRQELGQALFVTVIYAGATTIGSLLVGLAMALALRHPFKGRGIVRALALIPYVLPVVAAVMIFKQLLSTQYGWVNAFGQRVFGWTEPISFLSADWQTVAGLPIPIALCVVIFFEIWKSAPLAYLFITARLQAVSCDLEEAATIDGAVPSQRLRYVILPQLTGVLSLLGLLRFIWSFQNFNDIYLLTGGAGGTQVLAIRAYEELTTRGSIGAASAMGLAMMAILVIFLMAYVWLNAKEDRS